MERRSAEGVPGCRLGLVDVAIGWSWFLVVTSMCLAAGAAGSRGCAWMPADASVGGRGDRTT